MDFYVSISDVPTDLDNWDFNNVIFLFLTTPVASKITILLFNFSISSRSDIKESFFSDKKIIKFWTESRSLFRNSKVLIFSERFWTIFFFRISLLRSE